MTFLAAPPRQPPRRLRTAEAAAVFLSLRQSERGFQQQVVKYAQLMGWRVYHTYRSEKSEKGFPDLVLVRARHPHPRVVWLEVKAQRGRVTETQLAWIADLRACGQEAHIVRPSMWQEIETWLR